VYPILVGSQAVPKVAIVPLLMVAMGFGSAPIITMIVIMAFFPVVISTVAGLAAVPEDLVMLGRSMGLGRLGMFFKIMFPHALGSVFAGFKMAISLAMIGAVVGEFSGGQAGLGYYILAQSNAFNMDRVFAAVIVVVILSLTLFNLIVLAEWLAMPARKIARGGPRGGARQASARQFIETESAVI
jgi:NitT/TauT family transport system permease protein